jgi:hypothetical protein
MSCQNRPSGRKAERQNCRKKCPSFAGGEEGQRQSLYIGLPLPLPLHLHSVKES